MRPKPPSPISLALHLGPQQLLCNPEKRPNTQESLTLTPLNYQISILLVMWEKKKKLFFFKSLSVFYSLQPNVPLTDPDLELRWCSAAIPVAPHISGTHEQCGWGDTYKLQRWSFQSIPQTPREQGDSVASTNGALPKPSPRAAPCLWEAFIIFFKKIVCF